MSRALISLYLVAAVAAGITAVATTSITWALCGGLLAALALYERAYAHARQEIVWLYDTDHDTVDNKH